MKKELLIAACLGAAAVVPGSEAVDKALTFAVDYTVKGENIQAQTALGNPAGEARPAGRPLKFDIDLLATDNYGLQVGADRAGVLYSSARNFNNGTGTIELVIKNIDWEWTDRKMHLFFSAVDKDTNLYIYKNSNDGLGIYLKHGGKSVFLRKMPAWKGNACHHLAVTYDDKKIALYQDGVLVREGNFQVPAAWPSKFSVGPTGRMGAFDQSAIGRVRLYNRALTPAEVAECAGNALPQLKQAVKAAAAEAAKNQLEMMPGSPWFKERPRLGLEALKGEYVPAPWTPVVWDAGKVSVWNRVYDFSGDALASQIVSAGEPLLAGGVALRRNGKTVPFSPAKLLTRADGRVAFEKTADGAKLTATVEYDGALQYALEVAPGTDLQTLALVIPMRKEASEATHYVGAMDAIRGGGVTSPDKSYTIELGEKPGVVFQKEFSTHVWIGSTRAGLQFFTGSEQFCYPRGRADLMKIVRNADGSADLIVDLIVKPLPKNAPEKLTYSFGLIATPVQPLPRQWRSHTITAQYEGFVGDGRGSLLVYWPDRWARISLDPEPTRARNPEKLRALIASDRAADRKIIPYFNRRHLPISANNQCNPDALKIYDEWSPEPQRSRGGRFDWMRCSGNTAWMDYLVWCADEFSRLYGPIDGVYFDEMILDPNTRAASGGGYDDFDGARRPTYSVQADRDLYKRLQYVLTKRNGGKPVWSIAHCSATQMMELLSAFPVLLTGEHLYSGYFPNHPTLMPPPHDKLYYYSYSLPMHRVKYEFFHRQWGAVIAFLPCLKNQRDIMELVEPTRDLLSRLMHADVLIWPLWCNRDEVAKTIAVRRAFDIGADDVVFVPYWENKEITSDKDTYISFYRHGKDDRSLILVSNLAREKREIKVKFRDPARFGAMKNAETGKELTAANGELTLTIPRNDFCWIIADAPAGKR